MIIIVPSKFAFFLYGHHGYRYYNKKYIKKLAKKSRFKIKTFQKIGGMVSFSFHVLVNVIVLLENKIKNILNKIFRFKFKSKFNFFGNDEPYMKRLNKNILLKCKKFDNFLPIFENGYLIIFEKK